IDRARQPRAEPGEGPEPVLRGSRDGKPPLGNRNTGSDPEGRAGDRCVRGHRWTASPRARRPGRERTEMRKGRFMKTNVPLCVCSLVATLCVGAAESPWKAGLATVKITPETPLPMAGYASRTKPFDKVHQHISAQPLPF